MCSNETDKCIYIQRAGEESVYIYILLLDRKIPKNTKIRIHFTQNIYATRSLNCDGMCICVCGLWMVQLLESGRKSFYFALHALPYQPPPYVRSFAQRSLYVYLENCKRFLIMINSMMLYISMECALDLRLFRLVSFGHCSLVLSI